MRVNGRTSGAGSSRKVLHLLMSFDENNPRATADQLAQRCGIPLSTAYRYLALLREVGLLEDAAGSSFVVSPRVLSLARASMAAFPLAEIARPILDGTMANSGETSLLLQRVGHNALCVARSESDRPVRLSFDVGRPMPLHRGAAAKILMSTLTRAERDTYFEQMPQGTIADRERLETELETIAARGWTTSHGEVDQGIWAAAAAVSDGKRIVAALTAAGLDQNIDDDKRAHILSIVQRRAEELSRRVSELRL